MAIDHAAATKTRRLTSSAAFQRALTTGKRLRTPSALVVVARGEGPSRIGVVASRKVGSSVRRNRAKRLLREAVRAFELRQGLDVVLVASPDCVGRTFQDVEADVAGALERLGAAC